MMNLKNLLKNLVNDEFGQDLIEYALVAAPGWSQAQVASMKTLSTRHRPPPSAPSAPPSPATSRNLAF